jgi:hypothetical protein
MKIGNTRINTTTPPTHDGADLGKQLTAPTVKTSDRHAAANAMERFMNTESLHVVAAGGAAIAASFLISVILSALPMDTTRGSTPIPAEQSESVASFANRIQKENNQNFRSMVNNIK